MLRVIFNLSANDYVDIQIIIFLKKSNMTMTTITASAMTLSAKTFVEKKKQNLDS